ncbi:MAG: ABC transporter ATP-binding protein [Lachnospiraceae bacterium]|nr:ABC transporter ATP-binding protein [Lachnospiraceae bacterium]
MDTLLKVEDLNIEFTDHKTPETVVYDFDLVLNEGDIVGLVGESGSGKSMSALAIAGLLSRHDMNKSGSIIFEGRELLNCPRSDLRELQGDKICMVFQEPMTSLDPVKRIGWQVEEGLRIHEKDLPDEEYKARAIAALKDVELDDAERVYNSYPHELSGGMRQRVMIAAAIVGHPRLLICDEPTTALDVSVQAQIVALLKKINKEKKTAILFISHDLSLVSQLCERVLVMKNGYIVESGTTDEIFRHPTHEYTRKLIGAIPNCDEMAIDMVGDDTVARVNDLTVIYRKNGREFRAVDKVSFEIHDKEILGLVGESGSGKSTIAKAMLGIEKKHTGTVEHMSEYPQMIFQDPYGSLNPSKTIGFILEEPLRNLRKDISKQERKEKVIEALKLVGLPEDFIKRKPSELSGGQKQRVCIAQTLILKPKLIIADEPVSALDVTIQQEILNLMLQLHEELDVSILFISHDLRVVYKMCDRIIVLKDGRIVEEGRPEDIYHDPKEEYTSMLLRSAGLIAKGDNQ